MSARNIMGWGLLAVACVFLAINSGILARGAMRFAQEEYDRLSYGIIAGLVPWIIAVIPFVILWAWRGRHRVWSVVGSVVYVLFISYNLLGAGGAIAVVRNEAISTRVYGAKVEKRYEDVRQALVDQRNAIARTTRPATALAPMLEAERAKPWWKWSEECTRPRNASQRRFCASFYKLATEFGASQELARLTQKIAELDQSSDQRGPVATVADPFARFVVRWTSIAGYSFNEELVQEMIPLATPIVLEAGSMTLLAFGILLLGFSHGALDSGSPSSAREPETAAGGLVATPRPALPPPLPGPARSSVQTQFVDEWFAEHARPVTHGQAVEEERWYALYCAECALSNVVPVSIVTFREAAVRHGAKATEIDGRHWYQHILPKVA